LREIEKVLGYIICARITDQPTKEFIDLRITDQPAKEGDMTVIDEVTYVPSRAHGTI